MGLHCCALEKRKELTSPRRPLLTVSFVGRSFPVLPLAAPSCRSLLCLSIEGSAHNLPNFYSGIMPKVSGPINSSYSPDGDPKFFSKKIDPLPVYGGRLIVVRGVSPVGMGLTHD